MESPWCAAGIPSAHWSDNGGAKPLEAKEEVAVLGFAGMGVCASTGRTATHFSASRCAAGGEPSGGTPDGGENKDMPRKYIKIRYSEGEATETDSPGSEAL